MWACPVLGMLIASFLTQVTWLGSAFGAQVLAMYIVSGIYCLVYREKTPIETLQYVTTAYFLPGAVLAFFAGLVTKRMLATAKGLKKH
jgi:ABC-type sugar transport system permease subunit